MPALGDRSRTLQSLKVECSSGNLVLPTSFQTYASPLKPHFSKEMSWFLELEAYHLELTRISEAGFPPQTYPVKPQEYDLGIYFYPSNSDLRPLCQHSRASKMVVKDVVLQSGLTKLSHL